MIAWRARGGRAGSARPLVAAGVIAASLIVGPAAADIDIRTIDLPNFEGKQAADLEDLRPNMLADSIVARGTGSIAAAWLIEPTERYGHGILGDAIEAAGLSVETETGAVLSMQLEEDAVFEDLKPRLVDLNGNGMPEVLLVKSYLNAGAALALLKITDGQLAVAAESAPIGTPNRWLNPIGAADFDGDGVIEVAHIETPHIGGTLVLSRRQGKRLATIAREPGFSNHRIGSRLLDLAAIIDADGNGVADLVIPDNSRRRLRVVSFAGGEFRELAHIDLGAEIATFIDPPLSAGGAAPKLVLQLVTGDVIGLEFTGGTAN